MVIRYITMLVICQFCVIHTQKKHQKMKCKINSTSTLSHSPLLNPVLRFLTTTELTVAACPPE